MRNAQHVKSCFFYCGLNLQEQTGFQRKRLKTTPIDAFFKPVSSPSPPQASLPTPTSTTETESRGENEEQTQQDANAADAIVSSTAAPTLPARIPPVSSAIEDSSTGNGSATEQQSSTDSQTVLNDIGDYLGKQISDFEKCQLLQQPWQPPDNYNYPFWAQKRIIHGVEKEYRRYLNKGHLEKFSSWLVLSHKHRGLYCKYCPWFTVAGKAGINKATQLRKLVCEPLTKFKDLLGKESDLVIHENNKYHKEAVEAGKTFIKTYHNAELEIVNIVNQQHLDLVKKNRERLVPIVKACMFLGRQGLAFRGHRDDGSLLQPENEKDELFKENNSSIVQNEGNFREVLRLMVDSGDKKLKEHLQQMLKLPTLVKLLKML